MLVSCTWRAPRTTNAPTARATSSGVPWMTASRTTSRGTASASLSASARPYAVGMKLVSPKAPSPSGCSAPRAAKASAGRVSAMNLISRESSMAASASSRVSATTTRA